MGFWDDIAEDEAPAQIVAQAPSEAVDLGRRAAIQELVRIEEDIYAGDLATIRDTASFRDIDPNATEPPEEWVEKYGLEEATRRHRIARAAWLPEKQSPVGLKLANQRLLGIQKARSQENAVRQLNAVVVKVEIGAMPAYPIKKVET